ncbi:MAG: ZIP family metal transporter, partial [Lachnospiraceae bacterium]
MGAVVWAAYGTGFTFLMTTLGAAVVFFFRKDMKENVQRVF